MAGTRQGRPLDKEERKEEGVEKPAELPISVITLHGQARQAMAMTTIVPDIWTAGFHPRKAGSTTTTTTTFH